MEIVVSAAELVAISSKRKRAVVCIVKQAPFEGDTVIFHAFDAVAGKPLHATVTYVEQLVRRDICVLSLNVKRT